MWFGLGLGLGFTALAALVRVRVRVRVRLASHLVRVRVRVRVHSPRRAERREQMATARRTAPGPDSRLRRGGSERMPCGEEAGAEEGGEQAWLGLG